MDSKSCFPRSIIAVLLLSYASALGAIFGFNCRIETNESEYRAGSQALREKQSLARLLPYVSYNGELYFFAITTDTFREVHTSTIPTPGADSPEKGPKS